MISLEAVQAAIITQLKNDATLVVRLGVEMRESQWQGTQFTYPAIRVDMDRAMVIGQQEHCCNTLSRNLFSVSSMSEQSSSQEADTNMGLVVKALLCESLQGTGTAYTNPFHTTEIRMRDPGQTSARVNEQNVWTAQAFFEIHVHEHLP